MMMNKKQISRLKIVLVEQIRTNKWLADKLGKTLLQFLVGLQMKPQPRIETMIKIADILNVDVRKLLVSTKQER